jgi:hypothetical protein
MTMPRPLREHDISYPPARGSVMLLTCMDLRVLDEVADFMAHDNLSNRYDHIVFAGAALGVLKGCSPASDDPQGKCRSHWKDVFFEHLAAAIKLHDIQDVYILEHRHCGAYHKVFQVCPDYGDSDEEQTEEADCHYKYAAKLKNEIIAWGEANGHPLGVRLFLMDLRGKVSQLESSKSGKKAKKPKKGGKKSKS